MSFFASDTRPTPPMNKTFVNPAQKFGQSPAGMIAIPIQRQTNGNSSNSTPERELGPRSRKPSGDTALTIRPSGQALYIGSPRYPNTFRLNVGEDVDVTQLSCAISGQGQPEMWTNNKGGGVIEVSYRVGLVGKYKIYITYKGVHIEGSPFNLTMR